MGRRGLHDEAATLLQERLKGKIVCDLDTARRIFTLVTVSALEGLNGSVVSPSRCTANVRMATAIHPLRLFGKQRPVAYGRSIGRERFPGNKIYVASVGLRRGTDR